MGLSRSGNHPIINWIIRQIEGKYCFLNCAEPKTNPFKTERPLEDEGLTYQTNLQGFSITSERSGNLSKKDFLLYSYEDCFLGPFKNNIFENNRQEWIGSSVKRKDLLIMRDPFNLFASRKKAGFLEGQHTHHKLRPISTLTLRRIYKQHAKEFLGKSKHLKNLYRINFNRWATEKDYRKVLAENLGIPFTDIGFKEVKNVAGGSSFDGTDFSEKANDMKVNDRWKRYAFEEDFWNLFDEEIIDLSEEIFGSTPALEFYKNKFYSHNT